MKRLTKNQILSIKKLAQNGKSLNQISVLLDLQKTTVYYHFLKFKGRTYDPITINISSDEDIGEFIGLFAGDGSYFYSPKRGHMIRLHFNKSEKDYVTDLISSVLINLLGKAPKTYFGKNRLDIHILSKPLISFIKKYLIWNENEKKTYSIRLQDKSFSKKFKKGFLRGSIDSDGHFTNKVATFASVSEDLIENISSFLNDFEIVHNKSKYVVKRENRKPIFQITIKKSSYERFRALINPRNRIQYEKHLKKEASYR